MRFSIFILAVVCILGFFNVAHAQLFNLSQTTIDIQLVPEVPGPNEEIYVSLASYATDLNAANITWTVNGKNIKSAIGEKTFTFNTGGVGVKTTLSITIRTAEGELIEKSLTIKPTEVDLMWQSKSFVHPFYKGKAMFSHQNEITFIAIPHITNSGGQEIGVKNLIYKWKKNGTVIEDSSGFGKNSYTFNGPLISRPVEVSVEVSTLNDEGIAFNSTLVEPQDPFVIFYKKDPTYGIGFQRSLQGTVELNNSREITVVAMPFFFGTLIQSPAELLYKWFINGTPIGNDSGAYTQVFRQIEGVSGSSRISLSIENERKILQFSSKNFDLSFRSNEE